MKSTREEVLFAAALERPEAERAAFIAGACMGDATLRAGLESLLAAHDAGSNPLPLSMPIAPTVRMEPVNLETPDDATGQTLGRYKVLERLGEGGCGVVYIANQSEPVRRRVALKIIKPGMDSRQVVARFEAERQALAMMDHPHIAKVFDAGTTGSGRPYFVMEWVRGIRITDFCDQANLSTWDRLVLFIKVCQAIQHAHQRGVIHRDIKPSNILVTLHERVPEPKVIDFGIAKATEGRLTDNTIYTQLNQFIGTPAYMSPEQAEMGGVYIDTRSDIYSLGVLLYELLAGSTPFDAKELLSSGLDGMRRIIREKEPPRPSTRLAALGPEQLTLTAKRRSADTLKLVHQLQGDLDWIVMKCLEKDRQRRYETANDLAADIQRHLSNEPVLARPPSARYRFGKFARRNRVGLAVTATLAVTLVVATIVSTWQAIRARRAEALASARLAESESISQFLIQVFQSPDPAKNGRTITVAESLGRAVERVDADLGGHPGRRAQMLATLGDTYQALGLYPEAVALLEKVRDYHRAASGPEHEETLLAIRSLASAYFDAGRWDDAIKLDQELLPILRRIKGPEHTDTLRIMVSLAGGYDRIGRLQEALSLKEEAMKLTRKVRGLDHEDTLTAMNNLAYIYSQLGRHDEAIAMQEEVVLRRTKVSGPKHPATLWAMMNLGLCCREAGRLDQALQVGRRCVELFHSVTGPEHRDTLNAMTELAMTCRAVGRLDEAIQIEEKSLKLKRQHLPVGHPMTLESLDHLATCYEKADRRIEADALRREVAGLREQTKAKAEK